jgi:hypothetical protein
LESWLFKGLRGIQITFSDRALPRFDMRRRLGDARFYDAVDGLIHLRAILLAISVSGKKLLKNLPGA